MKQVRGNNCLYSRSVLINLSVRRLPQRHVSTCIWYCYEQALWHYSIDTCQTWVDVPMLDIRVVEGAGTVDMFDGKFWTHDHGAILEFFDTRYAQSGWHNMTSEFVVEYYDGVGYDGEPLKVVDMAITAEQSESSAWLNNLTPTGATPQSPSPDATITEWDTYVYGQWDNRLLVSWNIPHPSADYNPESAYRVLSPENSSQQVPSEAAQGSSTDSSPGTENLASAQKASTGGTWSVVCHATDFPRPLGASPEVTHEFYKDNGSFYIYQQNVGLNVRYLEYSATGCSLKGLVDKLATMQQVIGGQIENLVILSHGVPNSFTIGNTIVTPQWLQPMPFIRVSPYAWEFRRLDGLMVDGGQIQHWGCAQAGFNPYDSSANLSSAATQDAIMARRMFSTIAFLTNTYVFGSSDFGGIDEGVVWNKDDGKFEMTGSVDQRLEFGIAPDGTAVSYTSCSAAPWMPKGWVLWFPGTNAKETGVPQDWDSNLAYLDPNKSGYNPDHVATVGEAGGVVYPRLYDWFVA